MPDLNLVGDISFTVSNCDAVSLTWAIVPGNNAWSVRHGLNYGESHAIVCNSSSGRGVISHPVDVHFQASTTEGWPMFVIELWDRSNQEVKGFIGTGSAWIPSKPGKHTLAVQLWKPVSTKTYEQIKESLLPTFPNIYSVRDLVMSPHVRPQYETESAGMVFIELYCAVSGFEDCGVLFTENSNQTIRTASSS